jgi:predicted Rossmann fold nucleotide-binding protein DprA/Smf involved in DNA uptake
VPANNKISIVSGGQSGVDRAALDFALQNNISCGGWCPKGRLAEDGIIPEFYPLKESGSSDPSKRTRLNVDHSDGTLIIYQEKMDEGTRLTHDYARQKAKPLLIHIANKKPDTAAFNKWLESNHITILNIAGPRESNSPGIYNKAGEVLYDLFAG